jgi:hypothetical protein
MLSLLKLIVISKWAKISKWSLFLSGLVDLDNHALHSFESALLKGVYKRATKGLVYKCLQNREIT